VAEVTCHIADGVAVLEIRHPPVNALSHGVRRELQEHLSRLASDRQVGGIVLTGSEGRFVAGADIREFDSGAYLEAPTIRDLQAQLEASSKPVVAAIEGAALGGGLELAMACHARIAARTARVGLPEVRLGLIPGSGGTQRFPRLAGPEAALEYITSGEHIPASKAWQLGLVDDTAEDAVAAARTLAQRIWRDGSPLRVVSSLSERITGVSPDLFASFRGRIERRARGQLAPWKIIDCIEAACSLPREDAFRFERASFVECAQSPQRKALTHLFFAEREARRVPGLSKNIEPLGVCAVGIVGAGTMGSGIAMVFANAGIPVKLVEVSQDALDTPHRCSVAV
jgi:3-hydroxyacyl-CoA dehydrogenase